MKSINTILAATLIVLISACTAPSNEKSDSVSEIVAPKKMKMTTETPEGISTPNTLNTSTIGELNFFDGVPVPETADKVYDYIDLQMDDRPGTNENSKSRHESYAKGT